MRLVNLYSVLYDAAHLKNIELDNAISIPVKGLWIARQKNLFTTSIW